MANPEAQPFRDTIDLRKEVIETCLLLRDKLGYIIGTSGNVSARVEDGVLVTPSRVKYDDVRPEDLVVVGWEGRIVRGHRLPTSECEMHRRLMLDRPDFGALIHTHSPWAPICGCAGRSIPVLSDDMAEIIGGEIQCSRHVPSGKHREMTAAALVVVAQKRQYGLQDSFRICKHLFIGNPQCIHRFLFTQAAPGDIEIYIPGYCQVDDGIDQCIIIQVANILVLPDE